MSKLHPLVQKLVVLVQTEAIVFFSRSHSTTGNPHSLAGMAVSRAMRANHRKLSEEHLLNQATDLVEWTAGVIYAKEPDLF